jgi:hypothetical protein
MKKLTLIISILMLVAMTVMAEEAATTNTTLLHNEYVTVIDHVCKPGAKEEIADHKAMMVYVLEGGTMKVLCPAECAQCKDGKCCPASGKEMKAGISFFIPAGKYGIENIGATSIHALVVVLNKAKECKCGKTCNDCKTCKDDAALLNNCCVRAIKASMKAGDQGTCPAKGPHMGYTLTAGKIECTGADGKTCVKEFKAGEAMWCANCNGMTVKNVGDAEIAMLVIEIKE